MNKAHGDGGGIAAYDRVRPPGAPLKPLPPGHRRIVWDRPFSHDTNGYACFGRGVDGFKLYTDADYKGLKECIYDLDISKWHVRKVAKDEPHAPGGNWWGMDQWANAHKGMPVVLYGSTFMSTAGSLEFPTFMGEWCYSNNMSQFLAGKQEEYRGCTNYGRTYRWDTDEQITAIYASMGASFQDHMIWHKTRIAEKVGVNGNWHDNYSPFSYGNTDIAGDCCATLTAGYSTSRSRCAGITC